MRTVEELADAYFDIDHRHRLDLIRILTECRADALSPPPEEPDRVEIRGVYANQPALEVWFELRSEIKSEWTMVRKCKTEAEAAAVKVCVERFRDQCRAEGREAGLRDAHERLMREYDKHASCCKIVARLQTKPKGTD